MSTTPASDDNDAFSKQLTPCDADNTPSLGVHRDPVNGLRTALELAFADSACVRAIVDAVVNTCKQQPRLIELFAPPAAMPTPAVSPSFEPTVQLWASEVAAYLGQDTWNSYAEVLGQVWERTHAPSFRAYREQWLRRGKVPAMGAGMATPEAAAASSAATTAFAHITTSAEATDFARCAAPRDVLRMYSCKGKSEEEVTAQLYAIHTQQTFTQRNAAAAWSSLTNSSQELRGTEALPTASSPGPITDPGPFTIVGEIDGLTDADTIVEIKTRHHGVHALLPRRDFLQLQTYLHIHRKRHGVLVQRELGKKNPEDLVITPVEANDALWRETILPGLVKFVCDVRCVLRGCAADEGLRHRAVLALESTLNSARLSPPDKSPAGQRVAGVGRFNNGSPETAAAVPPPLPVAAPLPALVMAAPKKKSPPSSGASNGFVGGSLPPLPPLPAPSDSERIIVLPAAVPQQPKKKAAPPAPVPTAEPLLPSISGIVEEVVPDARTHAIPLEPAAACKPSVDEVLYPSVAAVAAAAAAEVVKKPSSRHSQKPVSRQQRQDDVVVAVKRSRWPSPPPVQPPVQLGLRSRAAAGVRTRAQAAHRKKPRFL